MRILPGKPTARLAALLVMSAGLFLAGCQTLEQIAPPVAVVTSKPSAQWSLGREIYITKCAKCHAPEPILKYTVSEWTVIVPDMAEETKLTEHETAAVRDYVMTVLAGTGKSRPSQEPRG